MPAASACRIRGVTNSHEWDYNSEISSPKCDQSEVRDIYDPVGRTAATINPLLIRASTLYDLTGRSIATVDAYLNRTSTVYDPAGRSIASINPLALRTSSVYDIGNRVIVTIDPLWNRTSTAYDKLNRALARIDPLGHRTSTVYDLLGRTQATIDALLNRNTSVFDPIGQKLASVNPVLARTSTIYDIASRTIASINGLAFRTSSVYNPVNLVVASIDAKLNRTTTIYDIANRTLATMDQLKFRTSMVMDGLGQVLARIDPTFNRTSSIYDADRRIVASIDQLAFRTSTIFDVASRSVGSIDALYNRSTTVYDLINRVVAMVNPLNQRTSSVYDIASRKIAGIDALGYRTSTIYDNASRTIATVNALFYRQSMIYDVASRKIANIDANSNRVTFLLDALSRDVGTIDPLNRRVTNQYDVASRKVVKQDARQNRVSTTFDAANQVTQDQITNFPSTNKVYDPLGNRTQMTDSTGTTNTAYDPLSRVQLVQPASGMKLSYSYDPLSRRSQMVNPDGNPFNYARDGKGQLTQVNNPQNKETNIRLDALGRQSVQIHANGARVSSIYDGASRVIGQVQADGGGTIRRVTFVNDPTGRKIRALESNGLRSTWTFDPIGQLINEQTMFTSPRNVTHIFDGVGNPILVNDTGNRTTSTFDAANQIQVQIAPTGRTSYTHDANGNRIQVEGPASLSQFNWDPLNRMSQADIMTGTASYTYDGDGKRVTKSVNGEMTQFVYDFENLERETDGSGNLENEYTTTDKVYGDLVSAYGNGATDYYIYNGMGSTEALMDDSGSVIERNKYLAFGLTAQTWGASWGNASSSALPQQLPMVLGLWSSTQFASGNTSTFGGQAGYYFDRETGHTRTSERYYDMLTQSWTSQDPIRSGSNWYEYSGNDPVNNVDPSGLQPEQKKRPETDDQGITFRNVAPPEGKELKEGTDEYERYWELILTAVRVKINPNNSTPKLKIKKNEIVKEIAKLRQLDEKKAEGEVQRQVSIALSSRNLNEEELEKYWDLIQTYENMLPHEPSEKISEKDQEIQSDVVNQLAELRDIPRGLAKQEIVHQIKRMQYRQLLDRYIRTQVKADKYTPEINAILDEIIGQVAKLRGIDRDEASREIAKLAKPYIEGEILRQAAEEDAALKQFRSKVTADNPRPPERKEIVVYAIYSPDNEDNPIDEYTRHDPAARGIQRSIEGTYQFVRHPISTIENALTGIGRMLQKRPSEVFRAFAEEEWKEITRNPIEWAAKTGTDLVTMQKLLKLAGEAKGRFTPKGIDYSGAEREVAERIAREDLKSPRRQPRWGESPRSHSWDPPTRAQTRRAVDLARQFDVPIRLLETGGRFYVERAIPDSVLYEISEGIGLEISQTEITNLGRTRHLVMVGTEDSVPAVNTALMRGEMPNATIGRVVHTHPPAATRAGVGPSFEDLEIADRNGYTVNLLQRARDTGRLVPLRFTPEEARRQLAELGR
jgi:RHS repeat-associated protein